MKPVTMELEEDMVMIIVGDNPDDAQPKEIKQEVAEDDDANESTEETNSENVEHLLETAEKFGEVIPINFVKQEVEDSNDPDFMEEGCEYLEEFSSSDEELLMEKKSLRKSKPQIKSEGEDIIYNPRRRRMLKPHERISYVKDLKKENPQLRNNEDLLIHALVNKMNDTKPPPPPDNYYELDETLDKEENDKIYKCTSCTQRFRQEAEVARHYQTMHGERYLSCLACGVTFRDYTNLYKHEKRCIAPGAEVVLKARAKVIKPKGQVRPFYDTLAKKTKKQYKPPVREGPPPKRFKCSFCPATFCGKLAWSGHENLHRGDRPYVCQHCSAPYATYSALNRHRLVHSDIPNICHHCGKHFTTPYTLRAHLDTHMPLRKYACSECPKRFAQNCALLLHVRKQHLNLPPPCACHLCPKRFSKYSVLKVHMRSEHGMELITRNMYIKSVPHLTEMELEEAKLIMKKEVEEISYIVACNEEDVDDPPPKKRKKAKAADPLLIERKQRKKGIQKKNPGKQSKPTMEDENEDTMIYFEEKNDDDNQQYIVPEPNEIEIEIGKGTNQIVVDISDTDLSPDVLQFVHKLQTDATAEDREITVVLINQGKIVHIVQSESDAQNLIDKLETNEEKTEGHNMAIISQYTGEEGLTNEELTEDNMVVLSKSAGEEFEDEGTYCVLRYDDDTNAEESAAVGDVTEADNSTDVKESKVRTKRYLKIGNNAIEVQLNPDSIEAQLEEMHGGSFASNEKDRKTSPTKKGKVKKETTITETYENTSDKSKNETSRIQVALDVEHVTKERRSKHESAAKAISTSDASHSEDDGAAKVVVLPVASRRLKRTPKKLMH